MGNVLSKAALYLGLLLLLLAVIFLIWNAIDLNNLATAASVLNRPYHNPIGRVLISALLALGAGFLLGLSLRSGSRPQA
jgi:Na+/proline symporter